jgi:uncharacterized membrane protein
MSFFVAFNYIRKRRCYDHWMNRNQTLDITRTLAIVLMVIFHFIYDLKFFGYLNYDIPDGSGWQQFRWVIISLFFLCLGVSLTFAHQKQFKRSKYLKRLVQISAAALLISIATYFAIPENWIFFGVLHFLAFASLIVVWFVKLPWVSFGLASIFITIGALQIISPRWPFSILFEGLPSYTNDYVAIFPWLGVVFVGVFIAHSKWLNNDPLANVITAKYGALPKILTWPGQHSLSIYLLHQPILMGLLYLTTLL